MKGNKGDRTASPGMHTVSELVDFYIRNGSETGIGEFPASLARQEFADECDINVIMQRYEATGVLTHYSEREPLYLDLTEAPDLMGAMDMMEKAERAFMSLPAKVRREFENDAGKFVEFASNAENIQQMREWGLAAPLEAKPPAGPPAQPVAPDAPAAPAAPAVASAGAPAP